MNNVVSEAYYTMFIIRVIYIVLCAGIGLVYTMESKEKKNEFS